MNEGSTSVRITGDRLSPLNVICYLDGNPYDWTSKTASYVLEEEDGTSLTEAGTITAHPTQTFTAGTGSDEDFLRCVAHGAKNGDQVVLATSGTLPTGLTAATRYYVVNAQPNEFKVSASPNGNPIDITAASGSGTHTFYIVGSVQIAFGAADVDDTTQPFRLWIVSTSGGLTQHFPDTEKGLTLRIVAEGN